VEVYKSETREVVNHFLHHRISFPKCIAALDAARCTQVRFQTGQITKKAGNQSDLLNNGVAEFGERRLATEVTRQ
jgi:hypothetical protein